MGSRKVFEMGPLVSRHENGICSFPFPVDFLPYIHGLVYGNRALDPGSPTEENGVIK